MFISSTSVTRFNTAAISQRLSKLTTSVVGLRWHDLQLKVGVSVE